MNPAGRRSFYRDGDQRLLAYVERTGAGAQNDPVRTCNGKYRHATWRSAAVEAQRMTLKGQGQCRAYRCPFCDRWHVGHTRTEAVRADQVQPAVPAAGPPTPPVQQSSAPAQESRAPRENSQDRRRYADVARLIGAGHTLQEACERLEVDAGQFQRAWAQERARHAAGAASSAESPATAGAGRPAAPAPQSRPAAHVYALLYSRWHRRRHDPGWASVPGPRLSRAKPVLRLEHLALLTDAERQALFPAPDDPDREARR